MKAIVIHVWVNPCHSVTIDRDKRHDEGDLRNWTGVVFFGLLTMNIGGHSVAIKSNYLSRNLRDSLRLPPAHTRVLRGLMGRDYYWLLVTESESCIFRYPAVLSSHPKSGQAENDIVCFIRRFEHLKITPIWIIRRSEVFKASDKIG